jgi:uncharacterized membrane protein YfcA
MDTIFSSPWEFGAACLVLAVAEAVYVLLGFGAGLVAVGGLALLLPDVRDVVVVLLLVNLPAEIFVVASSWKSIAWRGVAALIVGIAVGIPLGSWFLSRGDPSVLLIVLGGVLVVVGGVFLVAPAGRPRTVPGWVHVPIGLLSGTLTGLFGTGGPPLVLYYQIVGVDKVVFRGSLMAIFLTMTLFRVPSYAGLGLVTAERLWSSLLVLPAVLLGALIGNRIHLRIEERTFRRLVAVALVAIGCLLLARIGK